jgi:hypothetical protein
VVVGVDLVVDVVVDVVLVLLLDDFGLEGGFCCVVVVVDPEGVCAFPGPDGFGAGLDPWLRLPDVDCSMVVVGVVEELVVVGLGFGLGELGAEVEVDVVVVEAVDVVVEEAVDVV